MDSLDLIFIARTYSRLAKRNRWNDAVQDGRIRRSFTFAQHLLRHYVPLTSLEHDSDVDSSLTTIETGDRREIALLSSKNRSLLP